MKCVHNVPDCEICKEKEHKMETQEEKKIEVPINLDIIDFYPVEGDRGYYIERRNSRFVIVHGRRELKEIQIEDGKEEYEEFIKIADARDNGRLHIYDSAGMAARVIKRHILPLYPQEKK